MCREKSGASFRISLLSLQFHDFLLLVPLLSFLSLSQSISHVHGGVIGRNSSQLPISSSTEESGSGYEDANYRILLFLAQEEAQCLQKYGGRVPLDRKTLQYDAFNGFLCIKNSTSYQQCQQCRSMTSGNMTVPKCEELCKSNERCAQKCGSLLEETERLRTNSSSSEAFPEVLNNEMELGRNCSSRRNTTEEFCVEPPHVFCEDMSMGVRNAGGQLSSKSSDSAVHIVVLKWTIRRRPGTVTVTDIPFVFILEGKQVSTPDSEWKTYFKTIHGVNTVAVPYLTATYKWRVTAVGPQGVIDRASSLGIATLDGFIKPEPPKRIFIVKEVVNEASVDILVAWDPPEVRPCFYKVAQTHHDSEGKQETRRISVPDRQEGLMTWFNDLNFKRTYDVRITSRRGTWDGMESSNFTSLVFTMPSCLEAHNHRFDKCEPTPPQNISQSETSVIEEDNDNGEGRGQVSIRWLPPLHTSRNNTIKAYTLYQWPANTKINQSHSIAAQSSLIPPLSRPEAIIILRPEVTEYLFRNVSLNRKYTIALVATSKKGNSSKIYFTLNTSVPRYDGADSVFQNWVYLSIPISLMIVAIFGCHFVRVMVQKRQVKIARNQYFQSMDERDHSADWSIVPLNEDSPSIKLFNDFPKEKWEISYDNLIMGEVIGQGAFGVVRRAKMARNKIQVVAQKYSLNFGESNVDADGMETVAVKMLKVSATRDDRDQLIKEIVTMQNLGGHPQIVSLLGACTKGRSLCLVLEYCPEGDLLSFLRKVRSRYWPTLGLSDNKRSNSETSLQSMEKRLGLMRNTSAELAGKESSKETTNSTSSHRKSTDSSPINYADIGNFSDGSSSPDKNTQSATTAFMHEYRNSSINGGQSSRKNFGSNMDSRRPSFEQEEDCRPIDEKDILSYARQISMGMEYLEKNRVVHRDLAGRNVLLLGDFKQVKISDFGLSRDIYTWNVYHQKSNGKLPIKWMSIESIFTHVFTTKSDVWSFGILLWELVTLGGTPYPGLGNTELFHLLKSGYRMERPDNCSEEIYALMKKCWRTAPASRPNFTELRRYLETMLEAAEPNLYLSLMADLPTDYFQLGSRSELLHSKPEDCDSPTKDTLTNPMPHYVADSVKSSGSAHTSTDNWVESTKKHSRHRKANIYHPTTTRTAQSQVQSPTDTQNDPPPCPTRDHELHDPLDLRPEVPERSASSIGVPHTRLDDPLRNSQSSRRRRSQSSSRKSRNRRFPEGSCSTISPGLQMSTSLLSMESLVSPDSGFPRSDGCVGDGDTDEEISPVLQLDSLQDPKPCRSFPLKPQHSITIIENKTYDIRD